MGASGNVVDGTNSQFHAQDDLGQYNYGFSSATQTKQEVKTADGVTRGGYSYIDANGIVQTVNYISDALGFRVAATNLPVHVVDTPVEEDAPVVSAHAVSAAPAVNIVPAPAVSAAPAPAVSAVSAPVVSGAPAPTVSAAPVPTLYHPGVIAPQVQYSYLPYAQNYGYHQAAPLPVVQSVKAAPSRPVAPVTPAYYGAATYVAAEEPIQAIPEPAADKIPDVFQINLRTVEENPFEDTQQVSAPATIIQQAAPTPLVGSQYHAQDDVGQYNYGYSDGNSAKQEIKTADGVVRGAYSYVDSDGLVQHVNYIADALGFRVGATNLPVHNIDAEVQSVEPSVSVSNSVVTTPVIAPQVNYAYLPYASDYGYSLPEIHAKPTSHSASVITPSVHAEPVAAVTPVDNINSQFHSQDELGQYNYGYSGPNSVKQEVKTADGVTRGSYSYVDANGIIQTVSYISDAMGFRVAATNLPVHQVEDSGVETVVSPQVSYSYLPYAQNYAYNLPVAAAAA